jgi:hypothetical protein
MSLSVLPRRRPGSLSFPFLILGAVLVSWAGVRLVEGRAEDKAKADANTIDPKPLLKVSFHDGKANPGGAVMRTKDSMRFGLTTLDEDGKSLKLLTFDSLGRTNNTCVRVDGLDYLFGEAPGEWVERDGKLGNHKEKDNKGNEVPIDGRRSVWRLPDSKVYVTQTVKVMPGALGKLDTLLVIYELENRDKVSHRIGIRFLLDTYIGSNDGVPFTIPGKGLCNTMQSFPTPDRVPDYIEALEKEDLRNPGVVARLQMRVRKDLEAPGRVFLGAWPHEGLGQVFRDKAGADKARSQYTLWDVPEFSMRALFEAGAKERDPRTGELRPTRLDSAVVLYWNEQKLEPLTGKAEADKARRRVVGFTYGLGILSADKDKGRLAVSNPGKVAGGGEFTLNALVNEPKAGETLTLELPKEFTLVKGDAKQNVPAAEKIDGRKQSTVAWKVRAGKANDTPYNITIRSSSGESVKIAVRVITPGESP